jgi:hypothetical protein
MFNANIEIFEMSHEEYVCYFKRLENLEKIRRTNDPNLSSLPVDSKKIISVTSGAGKSSKNHKGSNMWCHHCDKNKRDTNDCRVIVKFQKQRKVFFEVKAGLRKNSFLSFWKKWMQSKISWSLKNASSEKRKAESILSIKIDLTYISDEVEKQVYLLTSSNPLVLIKLSKQNHLTQQSITDLLVGLIINNEEHLLRALADTDASSISILEAYTSAPFIKTDDNNTTNRIMGGKFTTTKTVICLWHLYSQSSISREKCVLLGHFM